jgi:hypothetical protein
MAVSMIVSWSREGGLSLRELKYSRPVLFLMFRIVHQMKLVVKPPSR